MLTYTIITPSTYNPTNISMQPLNTFHCQSWKTSLLPMQTLHSWGKCYSSKARLSGFKDNCGLQSDISCSLSDLYLQLLSKFPHAAKRNEPEMAEFKSLDPEWDKLVKITQNQRNVQMTLAREWPVFRTIDCGSKNKGQTKCSHEQHL